MNEQSNSLSKKNKNVNSSKGEEDIILAENNEIGDIEEDPESSYSNKRELLKKTKIVKQTWSIQEIYQKKKVDFLILDPDYQRNDVWKDDKKTPFIESLFMGILIPPIYVVEVRGNDRLDENKYEVVDGKQRLSTLWAFLRNDYILKGKYLEYFADWFANKRFDDIVNEHNDLTNEMLSSVLDIYVITANSPEFTKYDIFSRLNKGAEQLRVNEIRKAIYRSPVLLEIDEFVRNHLNKDLNREDYEKYTMIFSKNDIKHYEDYGRFYRSIAFWLKSDISGDDKKVCDYNSRPRDMINKVLHDIQVGIQDIDESSVKNLLDYTLFLREKLRRIDNSDYIIDSCIPFMLSDSQKIISKLNEIIKNKNVCDTLKKSPGTTSNVNKRLQLIFEIINS
jgi:hypothetical protein